MASASSGATAPEQPPSQSEISPTCTRCNAQPCICHSFIGGSEAHSLLNEKLFGRGCARALGYEKSRTPEDFPAETSTRDFALKGLYRRGHMLEEMASRMYMDFTGRSLIKRARLRLHPLHPGAGVHVDRIICATDERGTGSAEIKSMSEGPFWGMLRHGVSGAYGLQLQWALWVNNHSWGSFIVLGLFGEMPMKHFDVERDPTYTDLFARASDDFWDGLEHAQLPPQLPDPQDARCKVCPWRLTCRGEEIDADEYANLLRERTGKIPLRALNNDELDQALADRALILSEMQALSYEDEKEPGALQLVTARIKELLGDTDAALVNKHWKVYCSDYTWSGLDISRLKQEQPETYEQFYVKKKPMGRKQLRVYAVDPERTK